MNRWMRIILICVMIAAVGLAGVLVYRYRSVDGTRLREMNQALEESRASWERIAEEKVDLQIELEDAQNALREAELTLEDHSPARAEEIRRDIETLKAEIEALRAGQTEKNEGNAD